nr:hypothetical protein CPGR_00646 [Mycolicibacterium malmesburyense]
MWYAGDAQPRRLVRTQKPAQPVKTPESLPWLRRYICQGMHRHRRLAQHDLVPVTTEFVYGVHPFELHVDRGDLRNMLRQSYKELRGQQQFTLGKHALAHSLANGPSRVLSAGGTFHSGGKCGKQ